MNRWGLTLPLPATALAGSREHVERAEAAGYTDIWSGETNGPDGFTPLALCCEWTEKPRLGTGVVAVPIRGRALLAMQAAALADASGGRFALGIGASSDRIVEGWNRMPFEKPLTTISDTVDFLRGVLKGERVDGFKLETAPEHEVPLILAALRGKMLRLAVEKGDGAFTNFLPLSGLPQVTEQLDGAPEGFELLCRFFCLAGEREQVEPLARFMFSSYITVPVYEKLLPLARPRGEDRPDGRGLAGEGPPEGRRAGPVGADRGHVHPRHPGGDEGAARRLRRGRDHLPRDHPDHHARTSSAS